MDLNYFTIYSAVKKCCILLFHKLNVLSIPQVTQKVKYIKILMLYSLWRDLKAKKIEQKTFFFSNCWWNWMRLNIKCCRGFSFWSTAMDHVQSFGAKCVQFADKLYLFYVFSSRVLHVNMRHHLHVEKLEQNVVCHRDWAWWSLSLQKRDSLHRNSGTFTIVPVRSCYWSDF